MGNSPLLQGLQPNRPKNKPGEILCDLLGQEMAGYRPVEKLHTSNSAGETGVLDAVSEQFLYYQSHLNPEIDNLFDQVDANYLLLNFFYQLMEPQDACFVADTKKETIKYLMELPVRKRMEYQLTIDCCIKAGHNQYNRLLNHTQPLFTAEDGSQCIVASKTFLIADHTGYTPPLRMFCHIPDHKLKLFSTKEPTTIHARPQVIQIVRLNSRGMQRKEIADHLSVKSCTINNHIAKAREQLNLTTMGQIEMYFIHLGFLH